MAGSVDPPDETPEGLPGGGDEYRSVVFDESFVRAARIRELSALERMADDTTADPEDPGIRHGGSSGGDGDMAIDDDRYAYRPGRVRRRGRGAGAGALLVVLLVAVVFAAAVHFGSRYPYQPPSDQRAEPLRMTLVALAPAGAVTGGEPGDLFARGPAASDRSGAAGVALPAARRTTHFSEGQVTAALSVARDYLVRSSLDPAVVTGATVRPVRALLDPGQLAQFDRSLDSPAADGQHATGGWLVRFDPARVALADPGVRVRGSLRVAEVSAGVLEVTADHTTTYALRPAASGGDSADASLFTVRRELRLRFDRDDLRTHRVELVASHVQAGPMDCSADLSGALRPLLAGERARATAPPAADPYASAPATAARHCAPLSPASQPAPP
ncbi:hypothetical protein ACF053_07340 [Streptomyces kanasensis]|uniref:SCO2583 family membrane protein n=1 Tax=Streptomyces kanasensis TaxID=936756 RepID=UPI0036FBBF3D